PSVPGVGYGSNPFIDIGAYQYVNLHPPEVTAVTATEASSTASTGSSTTTVPFYSVGGNSGANTTPQTINVTFNEPLDPSTLNSNTVKLEELGVVPGTQQQYINLAGKIQYNSATETLVINLGSAGLNLVTDKYRLILFGSGAPVIANTQEIALDGENVSNGNDPNSGTQLPLPSGNGYPGGNFYDTFIINSTPPSILAGSLSMSASTDSNIQGDAITNNGNPAFTGTISEPNTALVPLSGQTAILNIGIALDVNGKIETFFNASQLPASLSNYAQYIRPYAGTALTDTNGNFTVTVGQDGASTGLVTSSSPLPDLFPIYNVGSSGILSPLPGTDSGYYVAQVIAQDQSGNQSSPSDPNAQAPFIVDQTAPTASFVSPTPGQVITSLTNGQVQFTILTNKNIDLTHFTAASIKVVSAGPDGILGTADDVTIPINPSSISVTYLDKGIGGKGAEEITFSTEGTLTNNLYSVTLLNSGTNPVEDIAGNPLASPVTEDFAISVPSLSHTLYVGAASYVSSTSAAAGTRENPYPTISAAMKVATAGDVVAVLPGVYSENVTLKQFVRLLSASASSTDTSVFTTSTGDPLQTIIRAPAVATATTNVTVTANGLQSYAALPTEIAGFTIASPLVGDPATGTINPLAIGLNADNSSIVIDKNYFADAGVGLNVLTSGNGALAPTVEDNVVVGNVNGMVVSDAGSAPSTPLTSIFNNDFVFNTDGLVLNNTGSTTAQAEIDNNIFWQNHDQTNARAGLAIYSSNPGKVNLRNNLFQGNGPSDSFTSDTTATNNLGNGFSAAALSSSVPDGQGNFVGNPAFAFPIDPRPGSDGPANLFVSSNFDLTATSAAIDNAWEATAVPTDLLGNSQVKIGSDGWGLPGYGPRDIGAYEFDGTGGQPVGGAFRVVTSSLVPVGGAYQAGGATLVTATSPTSVTLTFSGNVNRSTINATDLVLSGSADNPAAPIQATSLTWVDGHTVQFNLSGALDPGTLDVSLAGGQIRGVNGQSNLPYNDSVVLQLGTPSPEPNPTPYPGLGSTLPPVSTPAPSPTTPTPAPTAPTATSLPITPLPALSPTYTHDRKHSHLAFRHGFKRVPVKHHPVRHVHHAAGKKHEPVKHSFTRAHAHPKATTSVNFFFAQHKKKK
ncbi:MAG: beta strand repeat-containing protein, partial [Isosphaeraceae bacterium]